MSDPTNPETANPETGTGGADPSTGPVAAAERYLAEVREHLAGLGDDERDELLDDLAAHLHEVAADDPRPLPEVLGPPDRFAAELLASAGLDEPTRAPATTRTARLRARGRRLHDHRWTQATLDFLPELRPAWWVVRGYLIVLGLAALFSDGETDLDFFPVPTLASPIVGLAVLGAVVVLSVRLGRSAARSRTGVRLMDAAAIVCGLMALVHLHAGLDAGLDDGFAMEDPVYAAEGYDVAFDSQAGGLASPVDGGPITNIYAYDQDGELLRDVLLYDQHGRPLDLGEVLADPVTGAEMATDYPLDANGAQIRNAYPLDQRSIEWDAQGTPRERALPPPAVVVPPPSTTTSTTSTTAPPATLP